MFSGFWPIKELMSYDGGGSASSSLQGEGGSVLLRADFMQFYGVFGLKEVLNGLGRS